MQVQQAWLQPHEGVTGEDRPDDPVLTMPRHGKRILAVVTYQLQGAARCAHAVPAAVKLRRRMEHPSPGDYVVVTDILSGWKSRNDPELDSVWKGVGVFLGDRTEWWTTDEQWEAAKAEDESLTEADRMTDHAFYVQYDVAARDVCRWVNCSVVALPAEVAF